jgi:flagellar basal body-associated protein FliL
MGAVNPMFQPGEKDWASYREEVTEHDHRRGSKALWLFVIMLALALGVAGYYGWKTQNIQLGQLLGSQGTIGAMGQRVDAAEAKLQELSGGWEGIGQPLTKLEAKVKGDLAQSRRYAETLTQQLHQQITAELNARTSVLDARLRQVESEQTAQRSQMAKVEADLKRDILQEVNSVREDTGRDLSGVRQQAETNSRDVSALSERLKRERVDFELTKGQTKELIPGVTLRISGTDPAYQRYRGSLWLLQDRRTLWLRGQSVHEPVRFFHKDGGEPYELIMTDVTKKAAVGYLLVPALTDSSAPSQRAAISTSDRE